MKRINISFGTMIICASAAFISCSSSEDDNTITPAQPEKFITSLTVGAPTIVQDGADTRMTFAYDGGLKMEWEAGDGLMGTGYYQKEADNWYRNFTKPGSAETAGAQTTFKLDGWNDLSDKTTPAYTITYHPGQSTGESHTTEWKTATISNSQSQAGNDNTAHLKANYYAILQNINSIEASEITFSSDWAASHAASKPLHDGEELGKFYQSSCLKFDLTLPANTKVTSIRRIRLRTYESNGTSTKRTIYWKNDHSDGTVSYQADLAITGLESVDCSSGYHLIGYMMLPVHDWTLPAGTVVYVGIDYDGEHFYAKKMAALTSDWTLKAGNLGVIKLNSTGWK